eukprot:scaffold24818_cov18-Tisochrysis_lutea.AAC.1
MPGPLTICLWMNPIDLGAEFELIQAFTALQFSFFPAITPHHGNRGTRDDKGLQDRGIRSTRLKAEEDGQPIALTQQTELMAFMLRCNLK